MKKLVAFLLVLCMMAVMLPAFAALSFAEPTAEPALDELLVGREHIAVADNSGSGVGTDHGFLDGNLIGEQSIKDLLGVSNNAEMCEAVVPYVNGAKVRFNNSYQGYTHCGISGWGGGVWIGAVGAGFTKGETYTLTLLLGDHYYMTYDFEAQSTSLATESSDVLCFENDTGCEVTVVMADEDHGIVAGDTFQGCTHDECSSDKPRYTFTVTNVNGKTVTMHSDDFRTSHSLLELTAQNGTKIALTINKLARTKTVRSYVQFKGNPANPYDTNYSARIIVEGYEPWLDSKTGSASLLLSFATKEGGAKTYDAPLTEVYRSIKEGGDVYTPGGNSVLFGVQVNNVPFGTKTVTGTLVIGEERIDLGTAGLNENTDLINRQGYGLLTGETDITATSGKYEDGYGETVYKLFDKTASKYLLNRDQRNGNTTDTVTWRYDRSVTVAMYEVFSGNDTRGDQMSRNPKGWRLYGSVDGQDNWQLIDEVSAPDGESNVNIGKEGCGTAYTVDNPTAYQYYKIEIDMTDADYFQIAEIMLYEKHDTGFWGSVTALEAPANKSSDHPDLEQDQGLDGLFDGNANSKLGAYRDIDAYTVYWSYNQTETLLAYELVTGGDSLFYNRNPESWKLFGSNDGDDWTELDSVTYTRNLSGETNAYVIDSPAAFQYYKIEFKINNHNFQMADIIAYVEKGE